MIKLQVTQDLINETYVVAYIGGAITLFFNAILLVFVKRYVDHSLENHKISYSGVFKEKIEVHRELLKHIFTIRLKIQRFGYLGNDEMAKEIFQHFEDFINYYLINQPFIRPSTLELLKKLNAEYQESFENFHIAIIYRQTPGLESGKIAEQALKSIESMNKFKGKYFSEIEDKIVLDMRSDLNTN